MKYYLIAGEASGDLHAGNLMAELKAQDAAAEFRFIGGDKMQAAGGTMVKHYKELAYMGFIPVLIHLPTILRNMKLCKQDIVQWKPDVVILVDYPGFNLDIAQFVHAQGICPVFYYISPKIWAWKEYRIKRIRRDVDELFSILPFEVEWFAQRDYKVHYVGNPCVDAVEKEHKQMKDFNELRTIAILPGSRRQEIKDNLGMMLRAASKFKNYKLLIAGAPNIEASYYRRFIPRDIKANVHFGETYQILNQSVAALVTSGTATLETAILRVPQVVCYYTPVGKFISFLRKRIIKVPYISLVNLIANREIVQELVADRMTVENIENSLAKILPPNPGRQQMLQEYDRMNQILGSAGASKRAATQMIECLKNRKR
jgi:lipid-A-disaccharide synthase